MEIWHFSLPATNSPATQLTTNTNRVNQGIAERLVIITQAVVTLVASFIVAMVVQWKLALITMTCLPVIFVVIGICMSIDVVHEAQIMTTYSHAASVADEALSSIRTVHAFWAHKKLLKRYNAYLDKAQPAGEQKVDKLWPLVFYRIFLRLCSCCFEFLTGIPYVRQWTD